MKSLNKKEDGPGKNKDDLEIQRASEGKEENQTSRSKGIEQITWKQGEESKDCPPPPPDGSVVMESDSLQILYDVSTIKNVANEDMPRREDTLAS